MEQQDRYCRNCGQQLLLEDRFCAGCGRPVHHTAHVPTPEADVPVPPPTPDEGGVSSPQQQQPRQSGFWDQKQQPRQPGLWDQIKRPMFWFVGSLLVASVIGAALDPTNYGEPGMTGAAVAGFFVGGIIIRLIAKLFIFAPLLLVLGSVFFVVASVRGSNLHFLRALFNPQMMVIVVLFIMASAFTG